MGFRVKNNSRKWSCKEGNICTSNSQDQTFIVWFRQDCHVTDLCPKIKRTTKSKGYCRSCSILTTQGVNNYNTISNISTPHTHTAHTSPVSPNNQSMNAVSINMHSIEIAETLTSTGLSNGWSYKGSAGIEWQLSWTETSGIPNMSLEQPTTWYRNEANLWSYN